MVHGWREISGWRRGGCWRGRGVMGASAWVDLLAGLRRLIAKKDTAAIQSLVKAVDLQLLARIRDTEKDGPRQHPHQRLYRGCITGWLARPPSRLWLRVTRSSSSTLPDVSSRNGRTASASKSAWTLHNRGNHTVSYCENWHRTRRSVATLTLVAGPNGSGKSTLTATITGGSDAAVK